MLLGYMGAHESEVEEDSVEEFRVEDVQGESIVGDAENKAESVFLELGKATALTRRAWGNADDGNTTDSNNAKMSTS
jgi:hypothetical protein